MFFSNCASHGMSLVDVFFYFYFYFLSTSIPTDETYFLCLIGVLLNTRSVGRKKDLAYKKKPRTVGSITDNDWYSHLAAAGVYPPH